MSEGGSFRLSVKFNIFFLVFANISKTVAPRKKKEGLKKKAYLISYQRIGQNISGRRKGTQIFGSQNQNCRKFLTIETTYET